MSPVPCSTSAQQQTAQNKGQDQVQQHQRTMKKKKKRRIHTLQTQDLSTSLGNPQEGQSNAQGTISQQLQPAALQALSSESSAHTSMLQNAASKPAVGKSSGKPAALQNLKIDHRQQKQRQRRKGRSPNSSPKPSLDQQKVSGINSHQIQQQQQQQEPESKQHFPRKPTTPRLSPNAELRRSIQQQPDASAVSASLPLLARAQFPPREQCFPDSSAAAEVLNRGGPWTPDLRPIPQQRERQVQPQPPKQWKERRQAVITKPARVPGTMLALLTSLGFGDAEARHFAALALTASKAAGGLGVSEGDVVASADSALRWLLSAGVPIAKLSQTVKDHPDVLTTDPATTWIPKVT